MLLHQRQQYDTNTFNFSYFQSGDNIPTMQRAAAAEGSVFYIGAGKIMQALILARATDMLGDIPYSEASQGRANFTPKYDSQQQISPTQPAPRRRWGGNEQAGQCAGAAFLQHLVQRKQRYFAQG